MNLPRRVRTAAITNLGCKVNQSEMDAVQRLLRARGVELVDDRDRADLYVVNTCTVTTVADQKSRQAVRRVRRANPAAEVVVTGCSVQVDASALSTADPAARLVPNDSKRHLLAEIDALLALPAGVELATLSGVEPSWPIAGTTATARTGIAEGRRAQDRTRAFIKVQDGCSFFCTYCIIPRARGPERSLPPDDVLADVRRAQREGRREIVLTGINIGTYDGGASEAGPRGSHRWAALDLPGLVRRILCETDIERIRLSSIEPQHVDDALLDVWTDPRFAPRCLPHFHLPLQSGDDGVLRRMGRRYDTGFYAERVGRIRAAVPGVAIHGDLIVGFPTEDRAAWSRTLDFVHAVDFAGLHVFRYSPRPGTPATRMSGHVDERTRRERAATLLDVAAEGRSRFARAQLGRELRVLFEERLPNGSWVGHAESHVLVTAEPIDGLGLGNEIGVVTPLQQDEGRPDRLAGSIVRLLPSSTIDARRSPGPMRSRAVPSLVVATSSAVPIGPRQPVPHRRRSEGAHHAV